jgi:hypothetical protein
LDLRNFKAGIINKIFGRDNGEDTQNGKKLWNLSSLEVDAGENLFPIIAGCRF